MTVELGIRHRESGEYEVVPVATSATFREVWLPACKQLGLELVPEFPGGALTTVPAEFVPRIVDELDRLRQWAAGNVGDPYAGYLVDRCDGLLRAFARTDPAACD